MHSRDRLLDPDLDQDQDQETADVSHEGRQISRRYAKERKDNMMPYEVLRSVSVDYSSLMIDGSHYMMVLPLVTEANKAEFDAPMSDAQDWAEAIFTDLTYVCFPHIKHPTSAISSARTRLEFHKAVREELVHILCSEHCGFKLEQKITSNQDELILQISLDDPKAQQSIADHMTYRRAVEHHVFPRNEYPTDAWENGRFVRDESTQYVPLYEPYSIKRTGMFQPLKEIDLVRMVRKRMREFFSLEQLLKSGVCRQIVPVHTWSAKQSGGVGLLELYKAGWSDPRAILQWTGLHDDSVRAYFGEEFGFFWHWFNFTTRYLMLFPAPVGALLWIQRSILSKYENFETNGILRISFASLLILWGALYTKLYQRRSNFKKLVWGMTDYMEVASVRRHFSYKYRGTWKEGVQRFLHWLLALLFVIETLAVVWYISQLYRHARLNPDMPMWFGLRGSTWAWVSIHLTTINIKVVDAVWSRLSPLLSELENWRTDQDCKEAKIAKLFFVKSVVHYYPFLYTAFLKNFVEGCPGDQLEGCLPELKNSLFYFYVLNLFLLLLGILIPMAMTIWRVQKKTTNSKTTYVFYMELQAMSLPYTDESDDIMPLIFELGFVTMFTVVMPIIPVLSTVRNLITLRLLAYKYSFLTQRPYPRGSEGIGTWAAIIEALTYAGVTCNVAFAVFVMPPLVTLSMEHKCIIFILAERLLYLVKLAVQVGLDAKDAVQVRVEEHFSDHRDRIIANAGNHEAMAPTSTKVYLAMDAASAEDARST
mmetsp:Transcript_14397/g.36831  ORF Transcript_14397/g.36831 Transcript_14397/m.36831 type:complete len:764 (-) Transcript_14397:80-2371(-)